MKNDFILYFYNAHLEISKIIRLCEELDKSPDFYLHFLLFSSLKYSVLFSVSTPRHNKMPENVLYLRSERLSISNLVTYRLW